jgi:predicted hydrocarbon binding protein
MLARLASKTKWGREKLARKTGDMISEYGYGKLEYKKVDLDGESVVVLRNSCIAGEYRRMKKKAKVPVCSYIAGLLAGGTVGITGKDYDCRETKCIANGDKHCEFVIKKSG